VLSVDNKPIPFSNISAIDCTEVGYVGLDAQEITAKNLISSASGDLRISRAGIAFIDEIDKRTFKSSASNSTDISAGFQYGLLKFLEGSEYILNEKRFTREPAVKWNSYGVFFLLGGAFDGLDEIIRRRMRRAGGIGFNSSSNDNANNSQLLTEALVEYGICRQLLSRCTSIIRLSDPTIDELIRILDFENGILSAYNQILWPLSIALSSEAKIIIAEHAFHNRTFARGMKRLVSKCIEQLVYYDVDGHYELTAAYVREVIDSVDVEPITTPTETDTSEQVEDADITKTEPSEICAG
jgi:ATP-dependent Clp protease ATP-binding subunit ClpX